MAPAKRLRSTDYSLKDCLVADLTRFVTTRKFVRDVPAHDTRKQKQLRVVAPRGIWKVLRQHSENLSYGKLLMQAVVCELFANAGFTNPEDDSTAKHVASTIRQSCSYMAQAKTKSWAAAHFVDGPLEVSFAKGSSTTLEDGTGDDDEVICIEESENAKPTIEIDAGEVPPPSPAAAAPVTPQKEETEYLFGWSKKMAKTWRAVYIEGVIGPKQFTDQIEADTSSDKPIIAVWPDGHRAEIFDMRQNEYCKLNPKEAPCPPPAAVTSEVKVEIQFKYGWVPDVWAAYRCQVLAKDKIGKRELTKLVEAQGDLKSGVWAQWPYGHRAVIDQMPGWLYKQKLEQAEKKAEAKAKATPAKRIAKGRMAKGSRTRWIEKTTPEKEQGTAEAASSSGPAVQTVAVRPNQQFLLGDGRKAWIRSKHCRSQLWQIVMDGHSCCQVRKDMPGSLEVTLQLINMLIAGEATESDLLAKRDTVLKARDMSCRTKSKREIPEAEDGAVSKKPAIADMFESSDDDQPMVLPELW